MAEILHIRKNIFGLSQAAFAEIAGVEQGTVSRWERNEFEPNRTQLARIRAAALESGKPWDDRWFFEAPEQAAS